MNQLNEIRARAFINPNTQDIIHLLKALEAVSEIHENELRDKWGNPCVLEAAVSGWCSSCGKFRGRACRTRQAIESALEHQP